MSLQVPQSSPEVIRSFLVPVQFNSFGPSFQVVRHGAFSNGPCLLRRWLSFALSKKSQLRRQSHSRRPRILDGRKNRDKESLPIYFTKKRKQQVQSGISPSPAKNTLLLRLKTLILRVSKYIYTALKKITNFVSMYQQQLFFRNCFVSFFCFSNRYFISSQHILK